MGLPNQRSNKSQKGTVSVSPYKNGVRLRWRYSDKRQALYISSSIANHQKIAHVIKGIIERDILIGDYDETLNRYHELLTKATLYDSTLENQILPVVYDSPQNKPSKKESIDIIQLFNEYLCAKGKAEHNLSSYYYDARQMLRRWGTTSLDQLPQKLNNEPVSNKTFNDRRNCLFQFFEWCVRKQKIPDNPLSDVSNKKRNKAIDQRRPFTERSNGNNRGSTYKHLF
ncbi:MAG: hypothetical protein ACTHOF_10555 [Flavisolibacter sp.]